MSIAGPDRRHGAQPGDWQRQHPALASTGRPAALQAATTKPRARLHHRWADDTRDSIGGAQLPAWPAGANIVVSRSLTGKAAGRRARLLMTVLPDALALRGGGQPDPAPRVFVIGVFNKRWRCRKRPVAGWRSAACELSPSPKFDADIDGDAYFPAL